MKAMEVTVNRTQKSRLFEMIFSDKKQLLSLYNAVNGTDYDNPELLEVNTLENAIYMSMHNDISFIIDSRLSLYEHQSTYNPNLPLRYLFYIADLYSGMVKDFNLYGTKLILIPAPKFVIFYNGTDKHPNRQELKLSASYNVQDRKPSLELCAIMLNINPGHNKKLMKACKALKDYSEYVSKVRHYAKTMNIEDAVDRAITECIREGILSDFLMENKAEAKKMSIYEYDEEKHIRQTRKEGFDEGFGTGLEIGIKAFIETQHDTSSSENETQKKLIEKFPLSEAQAKEMLSKYWSK